jgi:uncharacterized protein (TIGR02246 family)
MKKWIVIFVSVLALFSAATVVAKPADHELQTAAKAMVDRFADSWNRADGTAYGENYWPDAELVDPVGVICAGKDAIVQEHVDIWAGPFKGSHITGKIRRIQPLGPNYMIVDVDLEVSNVRQRPPGSPQNANGILRSHLKHIMERRHGVWKVLSAQNTFVAAG